SMKKTSCLRLSLSVNIEASNWARGSVEPERASGLPRGRAAGAASDGAPRRRRKGCKPWEGWSAASENGDGRARLKSSGGGTGAAGAVGGFGAETACSCAAGTGPGRPAELGGIVVTMVDSFMEERARGAPIEAGERHWKASQVG